MTRCGDGGWECRRIMINFAVAMAGWLSWQPDRIASMVCRKVSDSHFVIGNLLQRWSHSRQGKIEGYRRVMVHSPTSACRECPWDRKRDQSQSLRPNTIEETYELCEALLNDVNANINRKLGDVATPYTFSMPR